MNFRYDYYSRFEVPTLTLCNPDDSEIGIITNVEGFKPAIKLNDVSTISFTVTQMPDGKSPVFDEIVERREILVEDVGYFIITDVQRTDSTGEGSSKDVSAVSCEYELNSIGAPYLNGTYQLYASGDFTDHTELAENASMFDYDQTVNKYTVGTRYVVNNGKFVAVTLPKDFSPSESYYVLNESKGANCILYEVMSVIPHWTLIRDTSRGIASADEQYRLLANRKRTFTADTSKNVYQILKNDIQDSYECFVKFDIMNRTIEILTYDDALTESDFILSKANILDRCTIKTTIDDYTNSLNVSSSDNAVNIASVNPLGGSTIYNFRHDLESGFIPRDSDLHDALIAWQNGVSNQTIQNYSGVDFNKWELFSKNVALLRDYVNGAYYYPVSGSTDGALRVVSSVTDIGTDTIRAGAVTPFYSFSAASGLTVGDSAYGYYKVDNTYKPNNSQDDYFAPCSEFETVQSGVSYYLRDVVDDSSYVLRRDYVYVGYSEKETLSNGTSGHNFKSKSGYVDGVTYYTWNGEAFVITSATTYATTSDKLCFYKRVEQDDAATDDIINKSVKWMRNNLNLVSKKVGDSGESGSYVGPVTEAEQGLLYKVVGSDTDYTSEQTSDAYAIIRVDDIAGISDVTAGDFVKFDYPAETISLKTSKVYLSKANTFLMSLSGDITQNQSSIDYLTAQIVAVNSATITSTNNPDIIESVMSTTKSQMYESLSYYKTSLLLAKEMYRIVENEVNTLTAAIAGITNNTGFEQSFKSYYLSVASDRGIDANVTEWAEQQARILYGVLLRYIRQRTYNEENITIQSYMTADEKTQQELDLYDYCVKLLEKASMPTYEITVDTQAMQFDKSFISVASKLDVGSIVSVELPRNRATEWEYFGDGEVICTYECYGNTSSFFVRGKPAAISVQIERGTDIISSSLTGIDNSGATIMNYGTDAACTYDANTGFVTFVSAPTDGDTVVVKSAADTVFRLDADGNDDVEVIDFNLVEIQIDYDSRNIAYIFGNRINRSDAQSVFASMQATSASAASIVASNYIEWGSSSSEVSKLREERDATLDATLAGIATRNSSLQDNLTINDNGFKSMTQALQDDNTWADAYGMWITNGVMMFTNDGWNTAEMAVGRLVMPDGSIVYGVNGDTILAHTISADKIVSGEVSSGTNHIKDGSFEKLSTDIIGNNVSYDPENPVTYWSQNTVPDMQNAGIVVETQKTYGSGAIIDNVPHGSQCVKISPVNVVEKIYVYASDGKVFDGAKLVRSNDASISDVVEFTYDYREDSIGPAFVYEKSSQEIMTSITDSAVTASFAVESVDVTDAENSVYSSTQIISGITKSQESVVVNLPADISEVTIFAKRTSEDDYKFLPYNSYSLNEGETGGETVQRTVSFESGAFDFLYTDNDDQEETIELLVVSRDSIDADDYVSIKNSYGVGDFVYLLPYTLDTGIPYVFSYYIKSALQQLSNEYVDINITGINVDSSPNGSVTDYEDIISDGVVSGSAITNSVTPSWKRFAVKGESCYDTQNVVTNGIKVSVKVASGNSIYLDGFMLENSGILNSWAPAPAEEWAKYTQIDDDGIRIYDGMINVYNGAGDNVITGDSSGNLIINGTLIARSGSNIAGWKTTEYGFYKEASQNFGEQDEYGDDEIPLTYYPVSGLFVGDEATYSLKRSPLQTENTDINELYFDFDVDQGDTSYTLPLLFTGYNGNGPVNTTNCKFYVDHNGEMKAVNALITGDIGVTGTTSQLTPAAPDGTNTVFTIQNNAPDDVVVTVDGIIQPQTSDETPSALTYKYSVENGVGTITFGRAPAQGSVIVCSSDGYGAVITYADINHCKIGQATLSNVVIEDSTIQDTTITNADIENSVMNIGKVRNYLVYQYDESLVVPDDLLSDDDDALYSGYTKATTVDWAYYVTNIAGNETDGYTMSQVNISGYHYNLYATKTVITQPRSEFVVVTNDSYIQSNPEKSIYQIEQAGSPTGTPMITVPGSVFLYVDGHRYEHTTAFEDAKLVEKTATAGDVNGIVLTGYVPTHISVSVNSVELTEGVSFTYTPSSGTITFTSLSSGDSLVVYNDDCFTYTTAVSGDDITGFTYGTINFKRNIPVGSVISVYGASIDDLVGGNEQMRNLLINSKSITIRAEAEDGMYTVDGSTTDSLATRIYHVFSGFIEGIKSTITGSEPDTGTTIVGFATKEVAVSMTKPIYLDGTVYVKGLKEYYGVTGEVDIVTAFNDVYTQIAINRTAIALLAGVGALADALNAAGTLFVGGVSVASLFTSLATLNKITQTGGGSSGIISGGGSGSLIPETQSLHEFLTARATFYWMGSSVISDGRDGTYGDVENSSRTATFKFTDMTLRSGITLPSAEKNVRFDMTNIYGLPTPGRDIPALYLIHPTTGTQITFRSPYDAYLAFKNTYYVGSNLLTFAGDKYSNTSISFRDDIQETSPYYKVIFDAGMTIRYFAERGGSTGYDRLNIYYGQNSILSLNTPNGRIVGYNNFYSPDRKAQAYNGLLRYFNDTANSSYNAQIISYLGIFISITPKVGSIGYNLDILDRDNANDPVISVYGLGMYRYNFNSPIFFIERLGTTANTYPTQQYILDGLYANNGVVKLPLLPETSLTKSSLL